MRRRLLYLAPIVLLGFIGYVSWLGLAPDRDPHALPSALIGKMAPQLELPALNGNTAALTTKDFAGQVTVVNFFASWCEPCRAEHPLLFALGNDNHVPVYGIAFKDRPADAAGYIDTLGSPYRKIGVDENGRTGIDFGITGVPETFILDRNGIVRYRLAEPIDAEHLAGEIAPLLKSLRQ